MMGDHLSKISVFVRSLYVYGVRHAVLSPGSRSTPLALSFAIHKGIEKHIVIDERSAGFMALGIGKQTGIPAVLVCTSGTAAANYMPAVVEARQSGVPLIIISADRPPHLRETGSSQTIDQVKLYGDQVVLFHEIGELMDKPEDLKRMRFLAKQAIHDSVFYGGAVHLNAPFRKPLEPSEIELDKQEKINTEFLNDYTPSVSNHEVTWKPGQDLINLLKNCTRPLIIAGPMNPHQRLIHLLNKLAEKQNIPVIAEPGSGMFSNYLQIHNYEQFLRNDEIRNSLKPDCILLFGDQPFNKSVLTALKKWAGIPFVQFIARHSWQDHTMNIEQRVIIGPKCLISTDSIQYQHSKKWVDKWKEYDRQADKKLTRLLSDSNTLTDGHIFHHFSPQLESGWNVMISNSFTVRDMTLFGKANSRTFVNRGAAGIDGIISTAIGLHLASEKPTCCFAGDIAFLHDSNALLSLRDFKKPFVIIVINNGGGAIFRMLPVYNHKRYYTRYFETPQDISIKHIAAAHSIPYQKLDTVDQLKTADINQLKENAAIFEIRTNPDESMQLRQKLWGS